MHDLLFGILVSHLYYYYYYYCVCRGPSVFLCFTSVHAWVYSEKKINAYQFFLKPYVH